jgi:hypothetical protein
MTRGIKETQMKITKTLLVTALAAAGLAATAAQAQHHSGRGGGNWSGHGGGGWSGRGASVGRHWGGGRSWGPRVGVYIGAPIVFGSYYWGSPWWDDYYYPRSTIVYRERIIEPYPQSYNEVEITPAEAAPRTEGAPTQVPSYRNYCESAGAYYPKVTSCPEGWRFEPSPGR